MNATWIQRRASTAAWTALVACLAVAGGTAGSQEPPAGGLDRWSKLEASDELRDYRAALREGIFEESSRKFLLEIALPQLAMPSNRFEIDRVRKKMFDRLGAVEQGPGSKPAAIEAALKFIASAMTELMRNQRAEMVVRVNAALLVGELRIGTKPWAPAVEPLAAALIDDGLPPAVRIAAAAGLARHVDADPAARATDAGPALVKVVEAPLAGVDPVAADWLRSRALTMLSRMGSAAPAGTVAAAARLLLDATQRPDLRVRAASAVGACVKAPADTDASAAVAAIRDVATLALGDTKAAADKVALAARLAGGVEGRAPVTDSAPQVYRRDAWRLAALADALAPAGGTGGLAAVAGAAAPTATALAQALRDGAQALDAKPTSASLASALESIAATATPAAAAPGAAESAPPRPAAGQGNPTGVDGVPFGS